MGKESKEKEMNSMGIVWGNKGKTDGGPLLPGMSVKMVGRKGCQRVTLGSPRCLVLGVRTTFFFFSF